MAVPCPPKAHVELNIKRWQDLSTSKFHLSMEVLSSANIDQNIFIFKQLLERDLTTGCFKAVFEAIATLPSMAEFAVDVPNAGQVFFRKKFVELVFDSIKAAEETEALILADINQLLEDMTASLSSFQSETVVEL